MGWIMRERNCIKRGFEIAGGKCEWYGIIAGLEVDVGIVEMPILPSICQIQKIDKLWMWHKENHTNGFVRFFQ